MDVWMREESRAAIAGLARRGAYVGTSSWKYPGWQGQLYDESRYIYRGRFSQSRFERLCLAEYAQVFKTVCVDAAYYKFPERRYIQELVELVTPDFLFAFKVTDQITVKTFPNFPRFGVQAGSENPDFLNADLFTSQFLEPCSPFKNHVGLLIFEFSRFSTRDFPRGRDFVERLDQFLAALPPGWPYGVEIRNRTFLQSEYLQTLATRGVAHIYNSWQDMPSIAEQIALPESRTNPALCGARLLLKPGRRYEEAVNLFSPYNEIKDPYPEGRAAGASLVRSALAGQGKTLIYVNNRFEGNALKTIAGILDESGGWGAAAPSPG